MGLQNYVHFPLQSQGWAPRGPITKISNFRILKPQQIKFQGSSYISDQMGPKPKRGVGEKRKSVNWGL